jgi:CubicO group peptidase (beta-lactamase class C family)
MTLTGIVLFLLFAAACQSTTPSKALDTACNANGCISLSQFSANLDSALKGSTGYVTTVGALAVISKDGLARTAADAPSRPMDTDLQTNVASISKLITTIGVLQSLANHDRTIDDEIGPFLPPDWSIGPNVTTITFRELLTHRAGFREPGAQVNNTYAGLQDQLGEGVTLSNKAQAQYNNLNFAIFRVLLPYMEGFNDPGPATRDAVTAAFYVDYIRQNVLAPAGITGADCKALAGTQKMLSYPRPPGSTNGTDWGDWISTCGSGGWVMTAGDIYKLLLALTGGTNLLANAQRAEMDASCLGWDCSVQTQTDFRGKNGILIGSDGKPWLYTFAGVFKGTVPVVVVVNSDTPTGANITSLVAQAFQNAAVPTP